MRDQAKVHNTHVDRAKWRLVGLCHAAETIEQAYRDVEYGIEHWFQYFQAVAAFPQMAVPGNNIKEMISFINDSGFGAIGTPDMVTAQIDRLMKQSNGGFGAYLMLAHNWADPRATLRSYELVARHVMPHSRATRSRPWTPPHARGPCAPTSPRSSKRRSKSRRRRTPRIRRVARVDTAAAAFFKPEASPSGDETIRRWSAPRRGPIRRRRESIVPRGSQCVQHGAGEQGRVL